MSYLRLLLVYSVFAAPVASAQVVHDASSERAPRFLYSPPNGRPISRPIDPASVPSLNRRIGLKLEDVDRRTALAEISRAAGINLVYADGALRETGRVRLIAEKITVAAALTEVLLDTGLDIVVSSNGSAALVRRTSLKAPDVGTISGRVTSAIDGKPIASASILIDGSLKAFTGYDGSYRITNVDVGEHNLTIRRLGYASITRRVVVGSGATSSADFALKAAAATLDQVVVTGSVIPTERRAIPTPINVVSAEEITQRNITSIEQLFRGDIPGLFAKETGLAATNFGAISMYARGASQLFSEATFTTSLTNRVAIAPAIKTYIDGVEMSDPSFLNAIDPQSIERIEIISGPEASTIYGSQALGGVMQVFLKHGTTGRQRIVLQAATGAVQSNVNDDLTRKHDVSAEVSGGSSSNSYTVNGRYQYTGAWVPSLYDETASGSLGIRHTENKLRFEGTARMSRRSLNAGFPSPLYIQQQLNGTYKFNSTFTVPNTSFAQPQTVTQQTLGMTVAYTPVSWWSHELTLGEDRLELSQLPRTPGYRAPTDSTLHVLQQEGTKPTLSYHTVASLPMSNVGRLTLLGGVDHSRDVITFTEAFTASTSGALTNVTSVERQSVPNTGEFAQLQANLFERLYLTAGIRAEQNPNYGNEFGTSVSPRYGASYAEDIGRVTVKLRASYGRATRPPFIIEKLPVYEQDIPHGNYLYQSASPTLGPEVQRGGDYGVEAYWGPRASISVTRYLQTVDDLITGVLIDSLAPYDVSPQAYTYQYQNLGQIRNRGWEARGTLNVGPFGAKGTWANTLSRVQKLDPGYAGNLRPGGRLRGVPEHTAGGTLSYTTLRTSLSVSASYIGDVFRTSGGEIQDEKNNFRIATYVPRFSFPNAFYWVSAPYTTYDLNAQQRIMHGLSAYLSVRNLTNKFRNDVIASFPVTGRISMIGLRWEQN